MLKTAFQSIYFSQIVVVLEMGCNDSYYTLTVLLYWNILMFKENCLELKHCFDVKYHFNVISTDYW